MLARGEREGRGRGERSDTERRLWLGGGLVGSDGREGRKRGADEGRAEVKRGEGREGG